MALNTGQREQRQEARNDDRGGKEDRPVDLCRGQFDDPQLAEEALDAALAIQRAGGGKAQAGRLGEMAEDVFDHDHRRIDDQPEIDRANRQQIGGFAAQDHDDDRKGQREGYGCRDDHRAAERAQKHPLHDEDQDHAEDHVFEHGMRCHIDQVGAVIDLFDMDAGGQNVARIDLVDLGLDRFQRRQTGLAAPHQDDALDDVIVVILPYDAKARLIADLNRGDILDLDGLAGSGAGNQRVADVVHRVDEANAAHHRRLRPKIDRLPADIAIGIVQRRQHLAQRQAIGNQLALIDRHLIGLALARPAIDIDHARHRLEAALEDPVLNGLEIGDRIIPGAHDAIAIDLANRAFGRNSGLCAIGQRRQL